MLKTLLTLFKLEVLLLLRRSQEWLYPLTFFLIIQSLIPLAFSPDPALLQKLIPGGIWLGALFSSLLALESFFVAELEDANLDQLLLAEIPTTLIILIKLGAQWFMTQVPIILLAPIVGLLFNLTFNACCILFIGLLVGTPILTFIGALAVALTLGLRQQGVWLSLLVLPIVTPVLIFGVNLVQQSQLHLSIFAPFLFFAGISLLAITCLPWAISTTLHFSADE